MDEVVFADGVVTHIGQIVGMVLAESQPLAQRAAQAVTISYDDLPSVITIEVRKEVKNYSFIGFPPPPPHVQRCFIFTSQ